MKKIHLLAAFCASALTLSACGPLPEYANSAVVPVTKSNWSESLAVAQPTSAPVQKIVTSSLIPASVRNVLRSQTYASAPVTTFDPTPMAVHANVYGSHPQTYNGTNGVRPFLVNTGSVWQGPSTYMLPVGTGNYAHQHLETVTSDYAYSTVVETESMPQTVSAMKNLFIRKGPGFNAEKCDVFPKGRTATLEYCESMWCKVSYKGRSGWSSKKYLNFHN